MSERDTRNRIGWIILLTVVLTATHACQTHRKTSESVSEVSTATMPESAAEMALLLRSKLPGARVVSTRADGRIDRSFFLTVRDSDEDALRRLPRVSDRAEQWRGTVQCEWLVDWQPAELFLEQWGEHGYGQLPFVFFGDKDLLAQIKDALRAGDTSAASRADSPDPASSHKSQ
jgi:hypothetical protein